MIEFGGVEYYIDLDSFAETIELKQLKETDVVTEIKTTLDEKNKLIGTEKTEVTNERNREVDGTKYDLVRMMIEVLIDFNEEIDDSLGAERALAKTPLSFRLAFNTLYNYGVLKEKQ
jgi:hypothetical protein